jgi:hypothetical protein
LGGLGWGSGCSCVWVFEEWGSMKMVII